MLRTTARARQASSLQVPGWLALLFWLCMLGTGLVLLPYAVSFMQSFIESPVLSVTQPATAAAVVSLYNEDVNVRDQAIDQLAAIKTTEATNQLLTFFQHDEYIQENGLRAAQALVTIGTPQALRVLVHSLGSDAAEARRMAAMAALEDAKPSANGVLMSALNDTDALVRENVATLLGFRRVGNAGTALLAATRDVEPMVRNAAAWSLSEVADTQALPRLEQMALLDNDVRVRETATLLVQRIYSRVTLAVQGDVRVLSVTTNGQAYAATTDALFSWRDGTWQPVTVLPEAATALGAGDQYVFVGTESRGLLRSDDSGQRFERVTSLPPGASVTALSINPLDAREVYVALALAVGTTEVHHAPLGVFYSRDGGATWRALDSAPMDQVTTQLLVDTTSPRYLFGATEDHAWRANIHQ